jgi:hypothetical protein
MLPLLFAGIVFLFLLIGSVVFLVCLALPPFRRYALSAALWCALWGPCSVLWMCIAGVGLIATAFITKTGNVQTFHAPRLLSAFGWTYFTVGLLVTIVVTTVSAWIHQAVVKRLPYLLFRPYAATVSAGIGSVFGWCFGWWLMAKSATGHASLVLWGTGMLVLIAGFGVGAYRGARELRGENAGGFVRTSAIHP